jgi:AbrB family looped-hinge helix DNA binding protein
VKIDTNGHIVIPPNIREQFGLFPGTDIQLEVIGDTLQIRKLTLDRGTQIIAAMRGKATSKLNTDEIMQLTRDYS